MDPDPLLDAAEARRLDFAARLAAVAVEHALKESQGPHEATGVILGSAFGSVDGCAAFMHRIFEKGPRLASPAEFPNLVPSAPVGHVSIYAGLHGPAFGTADLAASGESAVIQAVAARGVGRGPARGRGIGRAARATSPSACCPLSSTATPLPAPGGPGVTCRRPSFSSPKGTRSLVRPACLARVEAVFEWRLDDAAGLSALRPPRGGRAEIVLARPSETAERIVVQTAWRECPRIACASSLLESDALGAVAVAVAAGRIGSGRVAETLVLGVAQRRGYAILLAGP